MQGKYPQYWRIGSCMKAWVVAGFRGKHFLQRILDTLPFIHPSQYPSIRAYACIAVDPRMGSTHPIAHLSFPIRAIRASRLVRPASVLGGKYSKLTHTSPFAAFCWSISCTRGLDLLSDAPAAAMIPNVGSSVRPSPTTER